MGKTCAVVLIPGIFGFDHFGPAAVPRIQYFAGVLAELLRTTGWQASQFVVHQPHPTGPLAGRVKSLYELIVKIRKSDPDIRRVHLVGHSTGGVDARLLLNRKYAWPDAPPPAERQSVCRAVGATITIAAPFRGSPLARRLRGGLSAAVPFLHVLSILLMDRRRQRMSRTTKLMLLASGLRYLFPGEHRLGELIVELIDGEERETIEQVVGFLRLIIRDQRLHGDLTPEAMADLNLEVDGADEESIESFVTVAPQPSWAIADRFLLQHLLYRIAYGLAAPDHPPLAFPAGAWVVGSSADDLLRGPMACDGVVPASSQVLGKSAAGIVLADHLDVIGHYEGSPVGATYFKSGAGFTTAGFCDLWRAVGERLKEAGEGRTWGVA